MKQQTPPGLPLYRPEPSPTTPRTAEFVAFGLEYVFLSCVVLLFFQGMTPGWGNLLSDIAINFLAIMVEALPFMLIGSLAGWASFFGWLVSFGQGHLGRLLHPHL